MDNRPINRLSIVIPALNEEDSIQDVIKAIPLTSLQEMELEVQIIVVDNGSEDKTSEFAQRAGAETIYEARKGKGNAFRTAINSIDCDFVIMLDADNTYPPRYIPEIVNLLKDYDVVIGSRLKGKIEKGSMGLSNLLGNYIISLLATILYQKKISDVLTGYWGFNMPVLRRMNLEATTWEIEVEIFSQLVKNNCTLAELPIQYYPRTTESRINNLLKAGLKDAFTLVNRRIRQIIPVNQN
jgi:dolichol-phosphate mannosyltransferase